MGWFILGMILLFFVAPAVLDEWEMWKREREGKVPKYFPFRMDDLQNPEAQLVPGYTHFIPVIGQRLELGHAWRITRTDGSVVVIAPVALLHPWRKILVWRVEQVLPAPSPTEDTG
jgi:hypothetical protein